MDCPVCGHVVQYVAEQSTTLFYWCPRCGTLVEKSAKVEALYSFESPLLVEHCRKFHGAWRRFSIEEEPS